MQTTPAVCSSFCVRVIRLFSVPVCVSEQNNASVIDHLLSLVFDTVMAHSSNFRTNHSGSDWSICPVWCGAMEKVFSLGLESFVAVLGGKIAQINPLFCQGQLEHQVGGFVHSWLISLRFTHLLSTLSVPPLKRAQCLLNIRRISLPNILKKKKSLQLLTFWLKFRHMAIGILKGIPLMPGGLPAKPKASFQEDLTCLYFKQSARKLKLGKAML